jgi:hypothetical protein
LSEASSTTRRGAAAIAYRITMVGGLLFVLAANLPGHLSFDSVVALVEARTGVRQTWAPAVSSWLLKLFDSLVAGTGLYVTASAALLFVSLMSLTRLRPRTGWLAVVLGLAAIATPQVLIYQGIVWRDVLFANLVIAGFVCLAHAAKGWPTRRLLPLAGALVCLALAALVRQNGLILVVFAAGALAWTARRTGRRASLSWGLGSLVVTGVDVQDQMLADYAKRFYATPVYSHLTWALVAVAVILLLLRRRDPADWVVVSLLVGTLAFTASFAVISVACDYRYLYLLDLAAMVALIYTALDPPFRKRA